MAAKSTEARKTRRAKSWARGTERKKIKVAAQDKRAAINRTTRAAGGATPWQQARALRAARRSKP